MCIHTDGRYVYTSVDMPKLQKDIRVQEILLAAMQEFLEKGYYQTSMESIARRAGVTKGGLYHHFKGKDEILLEANKKFGEPAEPIFSNLAQAAIAVEGLKNFIHDYLTYWAAHRKELYFFSLSMTKTMELPALSNYHAAASEGLIALLQSVYAKGIRQGNLKEHDARSSALALLSALNGSLAYISMNPTLAVDEVIARFRFMFVDALA